ncbi:ankyrin repeat-containing domain protein [Lactarius deliciosus]|nr:ankyrin repeat-containing domain protein [Lactarius deliciosus]
MSPLRFFVGDTSRVMDLIRGIEGGRPSVDHRVNEPQAQSVVASPSTAKRSPVPYATRRIFLEGPLEGPVLARDTSEAKWSLCAIPKIKGGRASGKLKETQTLRGTLGSNVSNTRTTQNRDRISRRGIRCRAPAARPLHESKCRGQEEEEFCCTLYHPPGTEVVCLLLDHGANIDARDKKGSSLLHVASSFGRTEVARLLLNRGASPDARDKEESTSLRCVVPWGSGGRAPTPRSWRGRKLQARGRKGPTAPRIILGESGGARLLLDSGAIADVEDKEGSTPLCVASSRGETDVMRPLLNRGASANSEDMSGSTALHLTSSIGKIKAVHLLLDHGANAAVEKRNPLHVGRIVS